jgi:hypothetical protein
MAANRSPTALLSRTSNFLFLIFHHPIIYMDDELGRRTTIELFIALE